MSVVPPSKTRNPSWWPVVLVAVLTIAGCSPAATAPSSSASSAPSSPTSRSSPVLPQIRVSPADAATDVRLDAPVTIASSDGILASASVTDDTGNQVTGSRSADGRVWTASGSLAPSHTYTIQAVAAVSDGTTTWRSTFTTVRVIALAVTVIPADGDVVGVGMPLILRFNHPVRETEQVAFLDHLSVTASQPLRGAWHWWSLQEVRYRPETFWPAGAVITLTADLRGADAGAGVWGASQIRTRFTIGEKHVTLIDTAAHTMSVSVGDHVQYTWPASMGKAGFETIGGTLWVRYKAQKLRFKSCGTFGGAACVPGTANFYDQDVFWDTAVSTDGYFVHAAPWSVASQGHANVSHGCINLSPQNAQTFFEISRPGDVVQVTNSLKTADESDGEGDWQIPFAQYANSGPGRP